MNIGEKIKKYRKEFGITQKELADKLNLRSSTISKYENNQISPSIEILLEISKILNIDIVNIIAEDKSTYIFNDNILKILIEQRDNKIKGNLYHNTQIQLSYNSNRIEGSRLTEEETRLIYETNSIYTERNNILKTDDIIETINHFKLFDFMLDIAEKTLTEKMIKEFHKLLKTGTSDERNKLLNIGEYKTIINTVGNIIITAPKNVGKEINKLLDWYNSLKEITINEIIEFHVRFERIHPFFDGNGRVGRIIMFKECLKHKIIPFIIKDQDKLYYYQGLDKYSKEKGFLRDTCLNAQDQYIQLINRFLN